MAGAAFAYLAWTSFRNRTVSRLRRVRNPRYLVAVLIGAVYIWFFIFRNDTFATNPETMRIWQVVAVLALAATAAASWIFGGDRTALAFSLAEAAFLFPAPLTRRQLIGYKLFRAQLAVLLNTIIWAALLGRGNPLLPPFHRAIGFWILFTAMNFHRLGASLVRESWSVHGRYAARRQHLATGIALTALGAIAWGIGRGWPDVSAAEGLQAKFAAAQLLLESPLLAVALWPFRAIAGPAFAPDIATWLGALGPALVVLALHALWVVRTDAAFEEAALEATAARARRIESMRTRRGFGARAPVVTRRRTLALPGSGPSALAIVWKNTLCLIRTIRLADFMPLVLTAASLTFVVSLIEGTRDWWTRGAIFSAALAALLLLLGGFLVRVDLRQDMLNIVALKTLPLSGSHIVVAEVISAALPLAVAQAILVAIAGVTSQLADAPSVPASVAVAIVSFALPALVGINAMTLTIQNAAPVLFPAWTQLGTAMSTGIEALGQRLLMTSFVLVLFAVAMILPTLAGGAIILGIGLTGVAGPLLALVAGSLVLLAEAWGAATVLGRALDRLEPSAVG